MMVPKERRYRLSQINITTFLRIGGGLFLKRGISLCFTEKCTFRLVADEHVRLDLIYSW